MHISSKLIFSFSLIASIVNTAAEIDSGGGKTNCGINVNQSSIGCWIETNNTNAGTLTNHSGQIQITLPDTIPSINSPAENLLPDEWQMFHFGKLGILSSDDADGDGTSNLMEYVAGTDPNNSVSAFRPQISINGNIFSMTIATTSGRNYKIWGSNDLNDWQLLDTIAGDDNEHLFQFDTENSNNLSPSHFFRVEVSIP